MATTTTATTANTVKAAYDRSIFNALRKHLHFDGVADVKPTMQTHPGSSVQFTINTDLSIASTSINESVDVSPATLASSTETVTLNEYGNLVTVTEKLLGLSFDVPAFDRGAAERVAWNAVESLDAIAVNTLRTGSNVKYAGQATGRTTVIPTDELDAHDVRVAATDLYASNAQPFDNGMFRSFIHPHVAIDLREETGAAAWRDPHTYSDPGAIYNGSIGAFESFEFVQTPNEQLIFADAGSSTTLTDVYRTIFLGKQALAKAWSSAVSGPHPQVRIAPPTDGLQRFHRVGWYWLGGYGLFRDDAMRAVESASSVGDNS